MGELLDKLRVGGLFWVSRGISGLGGWAILGELPDNLVGWVGNFG